MTDHEINKTTADDTESAAKRRKKRVYWLRLASTLFIAIAISLGLSYLLQKFVFNLNFPVNQLAWLAYLTVFGLSVMANLSVIVPVPIAVSVMIAVATSWNPVLTALAAATGGSIGELSGYYAGYLGKKLAIPEDLIGYRRIESWVHRYGMWAIFFLAIQPIIPFDIGGFVAGAARMPIRQFLPALWLGKFPKYLILTYAGLGLINWLPFKLF
ncbi:VTT domain-containing protein [Chloroflexota bacterium]